MSPCPCSNCSCCKVAPKAPARYVAFVSGLSFGDPELDTVPASLMADYITGYVGSDAVRLMIPLLDVLMCFDCCLTGAEARSQHCACSCMWKFAVQAEHQTR